MTWNEFLVELGQAEWCLSKLYDLQRIRAVVRDKHPAPCPWVWMVERHCGLTPGKIYMLDKVPCIESFKTFVKEASDQDMMLGEFEVVTADDIFEAADDLPEHKPEIRAALMAACRLTTQ